MSKHILALSAFGLFCLTGCQDINDVKLQLNNPNYCYKMADLFSSAGPLAGDSRAADKDLSLLTLNPSRIRKILVQGDASLVLEAIRVHEAKEQMTVDRANLLPSLNLGVAMGALVNPSFMISSVQYFLPFLVPSKWTTSFQSEQMLNAERVSFLIADLNSFASAYALYQTMQINYAASDALKADLQDALKIERQVSQGVITGQADPNSDLREAQDSISSAKSALDDNQQLLIDDETNIKKALGLCSEVTIAVEPHHLPVSMLEGQQLAQALALAKQRAPELNQLYFLEQAAKAGFWTTAFSFISDISASAGKANVSGMSGSSSSSKLDFSFSKLKVDGGLDLSFAYFPNLGLASDKMTEIVSQDTAEREEIDRIVSDQLLKMSVIQDQIQTLQKDEAGLKLEFASQQKQYQQGDISLQTVIQTQETWRNKLLKRLQTETALDLARITFHRLMRTEEFEKVSGCWTEAQVAGGKSGGPCEIDTIKRKLGVK